MRIQRDGIWEFLIPIILRKAPISHGIESPTAETARHQIRIDPFSIRSVFAQDVGKTEIIGRNILFPECFVIRVPRLGAPVAGGEQRIVFCGKPFKIMFPVFHPGRNERVDAVQPVRTEQFAGRIDEKPYVLILDRVKMPR